MEEGEASKRSDRKLSNVLCIKKGGRRFRGPWTVAGKPLSNKFQESEKHQESSLLLLPSDSMASIPEIL